MHISSTWRYFHGITAALTAWALFGCNTHAPKSGGISSAASRLVSSDRELKAAEGAARLSARLKGLIHLLLTDTGPYLVSNVEITNSGTAAATMITITSQPNEGTYDSDCMATMEASTSCTFVETIPAGGSPAPALTLTYLSPAQEALQVPIPLGLNYGDVPLDGWSQSSIVVENRSSQIAQFAILQPKQAEFYARQRSETGSCGVPTGVLFKGSTCLLNTVFAPPVTGNTGGKADALSVTYLDRSGAQRVVPISLAGTAIAQRALTLDGRTGGTIAFDPTMVGQEDLRTFKLAFQIQSGGAWEFSSHVFKNTQGTVPFSVMTGSPFVQPAPQILTQGNFEVGVGFLPVARGAADNILRIYATRPWPDRESSTTWAAQFNLTGAGQ